MLCASVPSIPRLVTRLALAGVAIAAFVQPSSGIAAYDYGWSASPDGAQATVYDRGPVGSSETCDSGDSPDGAVNAYAVPNSENPPQVKIQMNYANNPRGRRLIGSSLADLKRESTRGVSDSTNYRRCTFAQGGPDWTFNANLDPLSANHDPSTYANRQWFYAPYFVPGANEWQTKSTIYALIHNEYHGTDYCTNAFGSTEPSCIQADGCTVDPLHDPAYCWFSTITLASSDGDEPSWVSGHNAMKHRLGAVFEHPADDPEAPRAPRLVAAIPYRYQNSPTCSTSAPATCFGRQGYPGVGNMIRKDGSFYVLSAVSQGQSVADDQRAGVCILRTDNLAQADTWRAWGGQGFTTQLVDPYRWSPSAGDPASDHLCAPISRSTLGGGVPRSVRYDSYLKKFIQTQSTTESVAGGTRAGVIYSLSDDLHNWSPFKKIMMGEPAASGQCQDPEPGYPSLIDPADPANSATVAQINAGTVDPNFNTTTQAPWLWFVKHNNACPDAADLVYQPIKFNSRIATFEAHDGHPGGVTDSSARNSSGFDAVTGNVTNATVPVYDGSRSALALGFTAGTSHGSTNIVLNRTEVDSPDVWYGAAFYLPANVHQNPNLPVIRWVDPDGNSYGGIVHESGGNYRLGRAASPNGPWTDVGGGNFSLAAYEDNWVWLDVHQRFDASRPLNEVFVNGKLVRASTTSNTNSSNDSIALRIDYGLAGSLSSFAFMYLDRAVVEASQRAPVGAPDTPLGLRNTSSTGVNLAWQPVSPKTAGNTIKYRVYKCTTSGAWTEVAGSPFTSTSVQDAAYTSGHVAYRVTAEESAPSPSAPTTKESNFSAPQAVGHPLGGWAAPDNC